MKIRMIAQAFTTEGLFEPGQVLTDENYSEEFLNHLAGPAKAAEIIEAKILNPVEENKSATPKEKKELPKKKTAKKKK